MFVNKDRASDRGAVAIIVAVSAIALFGIAAMAVDLGNGFARKRDVQTQADLAALAGAGSLPGSKSATNTAVLAARDYLNRNQPASDGTTCFSSEDCVTAAQLIDGSNSNGEVYFDSPTRIRVVSPPARVQFGLASALGFHNLDVRAGATAGIFSGGPSVMPVYAVSGCDWGPQSITAPSTGGTTAVPNLYLPDDSNKSTLDVPGSPPTNPSPNKVDVNPSTQTMTITGSQMGAVSKVGFFPEDGSPPVSVDVVTATSSSVTITLPVVGVTDREELWWIRVWGPASGSNPDQWSAVEASNGALRALPFQVGEAYFRCASQSSEGNYGTLRLPREDVNDSASGGWLPYNMAKGLQPPLSLQIYPGSPGVTADCASNDPDPTVFSPTTGNTSIADLKPLTNCVQTDPGLSANSATSGLITGPASGVPGRLSKPTRENCAPDGGSDPRTVVINGGGGNKSYQINDDILTCYFTSDTATVWDVSRPTYSFNGGDPVISSDIFSSPRFFWQPVVKEKPTTGTSTYKIIDMRAAFLTGQPSTAKKGAPAVDSQNGVLIENKAVSELQVVFLNYRAIEQPDGGPVVDWLGGDLPKLIRLVD